MFTTYKYLETVSVSSLALHNILKKITHISFINSFEHGLSLKTMTTELQIHEHLSHNAYILSIF